MSKDDKRSQETSAIKNAAELLIRGASLINEACPKCRGVQVKFKEEIMCINCGNEQKAFKNDPSIPLQQQPRSETRANSKSIPLKFIEDKIAEKIVKLLYVLDDEDLSEQKKKVDLLESYLKIIEKTSYLRN